MQKIKFIKMVASGNDFVIVDKISSRSPKLIKSICNRRYGIGADGLLLLEKSKIADIKMRIFNPDGREAKMCGNGARCVALWAKSKILKIETKAGIITSEVNNDSVKIKLTEPKDIKLNIHIKTSNRQLKVNFINTGVAHTVIFVEGLDKIDILNLGRKIRYHDKFAPDGTNVDFVEVLNNKSIKLRTYERGVEDETLACGTGAVASALITDYQLSRMQSNKDVILRDPLPKSRHPEAMSQRKTTFGTDYHKINVHTKSGEILRVYFERIKGRFENVWLEGKARIVCKGVYYV